MFAMAQIALSGYRCCSASGLSRVKYLSPFTRCRSVNPSRPCYSTFCVNGVPQIVTFNNGINFPIIGLGTWNATAGDVREAVKCAINFGYRHIDTAHLYQNESEVGEAVEAAIKKGTIERDDIFITSKLWNTHHNPDMVKPALQNTLTNLRLKCLDLYLMHWPFGFREGEVLFPKEGDKFIFSDCDYVETWKAMEKCVIEGLTKSIGVSNFNKAQIERLMEVATIKPVTNQVECHPYLNQEKLSAFCESHGIKITAYSPLGSPGRPFAKSEEPILLEDPVVKQLAEKYNKSASQILIRYQIDRGHIVIPKSSNSSRIRSNFEVFDFKLSPEDVICLKSLDKEKQFRYVPFEGTESHMYYPFADKF